MSLVANRKGLMAPQNNFLEKISKRFKGQRKFQECTSSDIKHNVNVFDNEKLKAYKEIIK